MSILVCGGANGLGAHVARLLLDRGERVVIADDFGAARFNRFDGPILVDLDLAGDDAHSVLTNAIVDEDVTAALVFPALHEVDTSRSHPLRVYSKNVAGLISVLRAVRDAGVTSVVYSSSAHVYGPGARVPVNEDAECHPVSPLGETVLIGEWMLADCEAAWGLDWIALRVFGVAGSAWDDLEETDKGTQLRTLVAGLADEDAVDLLHTVDVAHAHIAALDVLAEGRRPAQCILNLASGEPVTAGQIRAALTDAQTNASRTDGDGPVAPLRADVSRIRAELDWTANLSASDVLASLS